MNRLIMLFIIIGLVLAGCSQDKTNSNNEKPDSTKHRVYSNSWNGNPIITNKETITKITKQ